MSCESSKVLTLNVIGYVGGLSCALFVGRAPYINIPSIEMILVS